MPRYRRQVELVSHREAAAAVVRVVLEQAQRVLPEQPK